MRSGYFSAALFLLLAHSICDADPKVYVINRDSNDVSVI